MSSSEANAARQSLNATAILSFGTIVSNAILALTSVLIVRLLTPEGYGVYSLVLAMPTLIQSLSGFGINTAITRLSAYHLSKGEAYVAKRIVKNGITFILLSGLVLMGISILLAGQLSAAFLHRPDITEYVQIASILIFGQIALNAITATFIGWGIPFEAAMWSIIQASLKLALSIGLILLGFGILGAVNGYSLSYVIAGIGGIGAFYVLSSRKKFESKEQALYSSSGGIRIFVKDLHEMMRYGFPAYAGKIILAFSQQPIFLLILSAIASNTVIGYYSAASVIAGVMPLIGISFTSALFPAFSRLQGTNSDTKVAFSYAVKYSSYAMMPVIIFLIASSNYIIVLLYGHTYLPATYILQLLVLSFLPLAFGQAVLPAYFNGVGRTRLTFLVNLSETVATLAPAYVLVVLLNLGINGVLYTIIISNVVPTGFGLYWAKKYLGAGIDTPNLFRTYLVSVACYFVLTGMSNVTPANTSAALVLPAELIVFLGVYLTLAPVAHMVGSDDIRRLRVASDNLGIIRRILHPILDYEAYLIKHLA